MMSVSVAMQVAPLGSQISTKYPKAARSVEKKNLLLASSAAVVQDEWIATWMRLRKQSGLKIAGSFDGVLQPAPDINREGHWMTRPLSCSEITTILRLLL